MFRTSVRTRTASLLLLLLFWQRRWTSWLRRVADTALLLRETGSLHLEVLLKIRVIAQRSTVRHDAS